MRREPQRGAALPVNVSANGIFRNPHSGFRKTKAAEIQRGLRIRESGLRRRGQRGFTLLEALVATAVLGAAVAGLLGLLSSSLRNAARLEAPERALLLGQSKLNELVAAGVEGEGGSSAPIPSASLGTGAAGGTSELPFDRTIEGRWDERFRWEARMTRFRSSPERRPGELLLARVTLDVFWKTENGGGRGNERKLSFETYQLRRETEESRR